MLTLVKAKPQDWDELGQLHEQCWNETYAPILSADTAAELAPRGTAQRFRRIHCRDTIKALSDAATVGFVSFGAARDQDLLKSFCEIYAIYLLPPYQRKGDGRRLLHEAFRELRREEYDSVVLWTPEVNASAVAFCQALGFLKDGASRYADAGRTVREIRYFKTL
jgi:ribosomal protein S18 acetylase RimI-like enzyme